MTKTKLRLAVVQVVAAALLTLSPHGASAIDATLLPGWCATGGIIEYKLADLGFEVIWIGRTQLLDSFIEITAVYQNMEQDWVITQTRNTETCIRARGSR